MRYHTPVLLNESINGLNINPSGIFADLTFGGGGHSAAILSKLNKGKLFSFDQDLDSENNKIDDKRFFFIQGNFRFFRNYLRYYDIDKVDGVLADLGVSMHQFTEVERGFTYKADTELDMRMNKLSEVTAATILNNYSEQKLVEIFRLYADLPNARPIARDILKYRTNNKYKTTNNLSDSLKRFYRPDNKNKFLSKVYQALRIEVNNEINALIEMLEQSPEAIKTGGRIAIITYHSVEDRIVKNFFKSGNVKGIINKDIIGKMLPIPFKAITNKPIIPTPQEIIDNPSARSAKLRIAERTNEN